MNCSYNVKNLWENQCAKSNCDYSYKRLFKKFQTHNHNDDTLINTDPNPNKESFCIHLSWFS